MKCIFGDCGVRTKSHPVEPHLAGCVFCSRCHASNVNSGVRQSVIFRVELGGERKGQSRRCQAFLRTPRTPSKMARGSGGLSVIIMLSLIPSLCPGFIEETPDWGLIKPVRYATRIMVMAPGVKKSNTAPQWAMPKHRHLGPRSRAVTRSTDGYC